jgi:uncharacterized repeat protein (TIGR01451 family)
MERENMTRYARIGAILLIAVALWVGAVSAVLAQDTGLDPEIPLNLAKALKTDGPVFAGDEVEWHITLKNTATDTTATNIEVQDILEDFLTLVDAVPSMGTNVATDAQEITWRIDSLPAQESATLSLITRVDKDAAEGELENCAEITTSTPAQDTEPACASGEVSPTVSLDVTIKPETLNLKSRGVFTVFIRFSGETTAYSFEDLSMLECGGAPPEKLQVNQKDGGTLMAKYRRQQLKDVAAGEEVTITCEVTLTSDGESVKFAGSDTLRVIGEKKKGLDAFFSGILDTILPVGDEGDEVAGDETTATTPTATSTPALNRGQLKKQEQNQDISCTENCNLAGSQDTRGNGKKSGADDQDAVTDSRGKGNQGKGNDNGNGKGKDDTQDNGKGNGKNKN